jgi:hypothetical protein
MDSSRNEETEQTGKFEAHYARLSDGELVQLSADLGQLREIARPILLAELKKRGLERQTTSEETTEKRYVGVGGWLGFFVVTLLLLSPIASILELISTYAQVSTVPADSSRVMLIFSVYALLRISIMALGIYAAIRLIQIKPNAVRAARAYLIAVAMSGILICVATILKTSAAGDKETAVGLAIQSITYAIIWSAYLERSKRVATTYAAS